MPGNHADLAQKNGICKTIPKDDGIEEVSVSGVEGSTSLAAYAGQWIDLRARDVTVTYRRNDTTPTMVLNKGPTLDIGEVEPYWIDPEGEMILWHIASGAGTLEIHSDPEQK